MDVSKPWPSGQLPIFVNKALLGHSLVHSCTYRLWLLSCYNGRVQGVATETPKPKIRPINLKYLPSGSLQKESTSPYLQCSIVWLCHILSVFPVLNYYKYCIYEDSSSWLLVGMCRVELLCHRVCMCLALADTTLPNSFPKCFYQFTHPLVIHKFQFLPF